MKKRFLAMTLMLVLLLAVASSAMAVTTMYVYSDNGLPVKVRAQPSTSAEVLSKKAYGEQVGVDHFLSNGWACIVYGGYGDAYMMSRFLVSYDPGPAPVTKKPTPTKTPTPASSGIKALNKTFQSARTVEPYDVSVSYPRASGWVNLRWAPSKETELIRQMKNGEILTVIAELNDWLQVQDETSGKTGFVYAQYTRVVEQ